VQVLCLVSADLLSLINILTSASAHLFPCTVNHQDMTFDDEPTLPKVNNLATHTTNCKKKSEAGPTGPDHKELPNSAHLNTKQSMDFMAAYLKAGELNPDLIPTQKGFLHLFSTWILDESLPCTSGQGKCPHLQFSSSILKLDFTF
jgi:hypothetical protein